MAKTPNIDRTFVNTSIYRLIWVAVLFVAVILVVSAVEHKEGEKVERINIDIKPLADGHSMIRDTDVVVTLERTFGYTLIGVPLGMVNIGRIEEVLKEDPFVKDAEAYVDADQTVNIKIWQKKPVLRILDNNGLDYYLDENGFKMPLSRHFTPRVLTATGNIPPHSPDFLERKSHLLKDVFNLANTILRDDFFRSMIEQIHVSNRRELILIPKIGKQKIIFGDFEDASEKLYNLKVFYQEGLPYAGWQKYHTFNVKYKNQVVTEK